MRDALCLYALVFFRSILRVENAVLFPNKTTASETMLTLKTVCGVLHPFTLHDITATLDLVAVVLWQCGKMHEFRIVRADGIQAVLIMVSRSKTIHAVFCARREEKTIGAVLALMEIIPKTTLRMIDKERPMPCPFPEHL